MAAAQEGSAAIQVARSAAQEARMMLIGARKQIAAMEAAMQAADQVRVRTCCIGPNSKPLLRKGICRCKTGTFPCQFRTILGFPHRIERWKPGKDSNQAT